MAGLLHEINVKLTRGSWWSGWLCGGGSAVDRGRRNRRRGVAVDGLWRRCGVSWREDEAPRGGEWVQGESREIIGTLIGDGCDRWARKPAAGRHRQSSEMAGGGR